MRREGEGRERSIKRKNKRGETRKIIKAERKRDKKCKFTAI